MDFTSINKKSAIVQLPVRKVSELVVETAYPIKKIVRVNTKFGKTVLVETGEFATFLPPRFNNILTDDVIEQMNNQRCGFKVTNSIAVGRGNKAINIEFINI